MAPPVRAALGRSIQFLHQRPELGTNVRAHLPLPSILRPHLPQPAPLAGHSPARERHRIQATRQCLPEMCGTRSPASNRQLAHSSRSSDLRAKVACAPHTFFHRKRARRGWLPTPTVLLAGRILRQPRLPPSLGPGQARRASARRQSNHRTAEEDHGDLWPQDHQALSGQATNRDRGHEPAQSGNPQPLRKRLYQAICSRSPHPAHRIRKQQRQRLWPQQSGGKSPCPPRDPIGDQRQLSQRAAGHSGDFCRSRPAAKARGTNDHVDRKAHSGPQARSSSATRSDACDRPLRAHRGWQYFTTAEIHPAVIEALGCAPNHYTLASLRYELSKLRAKGLVAKLPNSRRYQLLPHGYSICLVFLKLFERVYAPLAAGLLSPIKADKRLESQRRSQLDRLYQRVIDDLDTLVRAVGLKAA